MNIKTLCSGRIELIMDVIVYRRWTKTCPEFQMGLNLIGISTLFCKTGWIGWKMFLKFLLFFDFLSTYEKIVK